MIVKGYTKSPYLCYDAKARKDEHGMQYRNVYEQVWHGIRLRKDRCIGRLYESLSDSRQQPKSLAMRLMEERR